MRVGQPTEIEADIYPGYIYHAHVDSINIGTGSAFASRPLGNPTGNWVKVVQRIPVKMVLTNPNQRISRCKRESLEKLRSKSPTPAGRCSLPRSSTSSGRGGPPGELLRRIKPPDNGTQTWDVFSPAEQAPTTSAIESRAIEFDGCESRRAEPFAGRRAVEGACRSLCCGTAADRDNQLRGRRRPSFSPLAVPEHHPRRNCIPSPKTSAAALSLYLGVDVCDSNGVLASGWETTLYEFALRSRAGCCPASRRVRRWCCASIQVL